MPEFETLSIIVPVYNEAATIEESVLRALAVDLPLQKEVIVVDDGSVDDSPKILKGIDDPRVKVVNLDTNRGKGTAVRTGIDRSTGDIIVIHDADLEYDPEDWPALLKPILRGQTEVSYGNRFAGPHRDMLFLHWVGNKFLSIVTNILFNTTLQDMETCYKAFTRRAIGRIRLQSRRFEIEPEITAKLLKAGHRIYEVPISYAGREFHEGKKITWKDGFIALWTLIKYRVVD